MPGMPADTVCPVIPALRYRDPSAAVTWLCEAFGLREHLVVRGDDGAVHHAQLTFGAGMIMLGPGGDSAFDELVRPPVQGGPPGAMSVYLVVVDADVHEATAAAAGADIVMPSADQPYGGRLYSCRDPEGHVWSFGTYDPWAE
jgi:uncharacterized glyoxalase superfamily protein PhnB